MNLCRLSNQRQFESKGQKLTACVKAPDRRRFYRSRIGGICSYIHRERVGSDEGLFVIAGENGPAIAELFQLIGVSASLTEFPL
jgi:hypothetical protein